MNSILQTRPLRDTHSEGKVKHHWSIVLRKKQVVSDEWSVTGVRGLASFIRGELEKPVGVDCPLLPIPCLPLRSQSMMTRARVSISLFLLVAFTSAAYAKPRPIPVKVVVVAMFEQGADTGDVPGELQWEARC